MQQSSVKVAEDSAQCLLVSTVFGQSLHPISHLLYDVVRELSGE